MIGNVVSDLLFAVAVPCYTGEQDKIYKSIHDKLPGIIKFMGKNKFLVGSNPVWVDFRFYELIELMTFLKLDLFTDYPQLIQYQRNIASLPRLGPYLSDEYNPNKSLTFNNKSAKINNTLLNNSEPKEKIFLIGGTGRTGLLFARAVLDEGHQVTAVVRKAPKIEGTLASSGNVVGTGSSLELSGDVPASEGTNTAHNMVVGPHPNLSIVVVPDQTQPEALSPYMAGHDVVVVTIGAFPKPEETEMHLMSNAANGYVHSMVQCGIKRVFTIFGAGLLGETV